MTLPDERPLKHRELERGLYGERRFELLEPLIVTQNRVTPDNQPKTADAVVDLPDDVVERSAKAILHARYDISDDEISMSRDNNVTVWREAMRDARAALEAARYGELRECLRELRSYAYGANVAILERADALLSSIGEPTDIGASQS